MTVRRALVLVSGVPAELPSADTLLGDVPRGTSFPGSPATGDIYWRSDRNTEYFYDGTRWLSTQLLTLNLSPTDFTLPITGSKTGGFRTGNPWFGLYDIYLVDATFSRFPQSSVASTWTFTLSKILAAGPTTLATQAAATDTNNQWNTNRVSVNVVVASTYAVFDGAVTLNSGSVSTGEYVLFAFTYRLVG